MIFTPLALLVFVAAALYTAIGIYSLRQRSVPAAFPFGLAILLAAGWAWTYGFDLMLPEIGAKLLTVKPRIPMVALLAVCWLAMALQHRGRGEWLTRRRLAALLVIPAVTTVLSFTMEQHQLLRYEIELKEMGEIRLIVSKVGLWWWVHVGFSFGMIGAATAVLLRSMRRAPAVYKRQTWLIVLAGLLPSFANLVFLSPFNPFPGFDSTTSVFVLTGSLCSWALFRHRFLDLVPVAREKVFEALRDVVVVVDPGWRIADLNPAAEQLLGHDYLRAVGKTLEVAFRDWPELISVCRQDSTGAVEVCLELGDHQRHFEVQGVAIYDNRDRELGRLITLRDATERIETQARNLRQERARALLESRDRLARDVAELLHGPVQTKLLIVWQRLSDCQEMLDSDKGKAKALLEQLKNMVDGVREDEVRQASHRLHPSMISVGLVPAVRSLVSDFQGTIHIELDISAEFLRLDDPSRNLLLPSVRLAAYHILEESLANVYRHANARRVNISLSVEDGQYLTISAQDDGCGFDPDHCKRGLGLTVIAGRAEQAGGTWQVRSAAGQGTAISASLPLAKDGGPDH